MRKKRKNDSGEELSFKPVVRYIIYFYVVVILAELFVGSGYAMRSMRKEADFVVNSARTQLEYRIENTISLLTSLAESPFMQNPEISFTEKAKALDKYAETFGYLMMCIVDKDVNVWDAQGTDANLGGRAYMQRLFATGAVQVTDSFAAGADGVTLNHTIAVPMMKGGKVNGCLFAAIYFSEVQGLLQGNAYDDYQKTILFGGDNQVMASPDMEKYGKTYLELCKNDFLFGTSIKKVDESMYNLGTGSHWALTTGDLKYVSFMPIANTNWTLLCRVNFWEMLGQYFPQIIAMILITTLTCSLLVLLANRFIRSKRGTVEMLITSVQELEKKIYQNEKPDNVDFREIISLTSKGLTDGLTGVITRTVFLNQIPSRIKALEPGTFAAMCFIDVDNLKVINDTYGHDMGDITLRNVGYVLREYEKKYDGLVARYGGDEFVLLLSGFEARETMEDLLEELTIRLHSEISTPDGTVIPTQCSIGAAVCSSHSDNIERLIKQADEMLYAVKQSEKGRYKLCDETN